MSSHVILSIFSLNVVVVFSSYILVFITVSTFVRVINLHSK